MSKFKTLLVGLLFAGCAVAHPMGNFSVSHYSRLDLSNQGVRLTYVLDLAEIPTLELFQQWQIDGKDEAVLQRQAKVQATAWLQNLSLSIDGSPSTLRAGEVTAKTVDGAGGMPVMRVEMKADVEAAPGQLTFEDRNYPNRTGWKEIVIRGGEGVTLAGSSRSDRDLSLALTAYPSDPTLAPPQDLTASVRWSGPAASARDEASVPVAKAGKPAAQTEAPLSAVKPAVQIESRPKPAKDLGATTASRTFAQRQSSGPGAVVRGDFLSVMLRDKKFGLGSILLGLLVAFGLGAMHALSPGHGKTIVAAYLVGSRGTLKHALFLGSMVTFTHTVSVFLLGLGVLFFQKYVVPDQIIPVLGAVSGLSIVCIGSWLLYQRAKALLATGHKHVHGHHHAAHDHHHHHAAGEHHHEHDHQVAHVHVNAADHVHSHSALETEAPVAVLVGEHHHQVHEPHSHTAGHDHAHHAVEEHHPFVHTHTHDGHTHSHAMPESGLTFGGLIALGASGGLVPCPSALILLLSAIALGQTALGLGLLAAFSLGLAVVLMGIGALVLFAKHLLPAHESARSHPLFRLVPVFSSVVVIVLGLLMALAALGWIQPMPALGS
jgi:nickel/cobalt transporter (NicO) family protein